MGIVGFLIFLPFIMDIIGIVIVALSFIGICMLQRKSMSEKVLL